MGTRINQVFKKLGLFLVFVTILGFTGGLTDAIAEGDGSIWRDDFNEQNELWDWEKLDPGLWSLTENPGFLRIYISSEPTGVENLLLRPVADGDFTIKTRLLFDPDTDFQFAGLVIWQDQGNFLQFGRAYCDVEACVGDGLYFDHIASGDWVDGNFATPLDDPLEVDLRLERRGEMVKSFYSLDSGISWYEIGTHWIPADFVVNGVGLTASQDYNTPSQDILADFDYFELSEGGGFLPEGYHDFDSGEVLNWSCNAGGWAVDPDDRAARINVEIVVDHETVHTMTAEEYREDLDGAGVCEGGECSFFHSLWGEISPYEQHSVAVWAQDYPSGMWVLLRNSPLDITCRTYDIYAFDPRTGQTTMVSNLPDMQEYNPEWSPDGRRVVHDAWSTDWSEHGLYISNLQTGLSTPIAGAERGSYPAWSPNGRWIAFDHGADDDYRMFIIPPSGGDPQLVVEDAFMASWAPNSQRLVYQQPSDGSLRTVKVDGSDQTLVTELGNGPAWSPNGQWIAYEVSGNLWKVRVNPQGVPLDEPVKLTSWSAWEGKPTWSSDSRTIVFHTDLAGDTDLWSIPAAGGEPTWLTGAPNSGDYDPDYARDGRRIAYAGGSPNGQARRTWVSAYTHDYGTWFEGEHNYRFEAAWSGGGETTEPIYFNVSSGAGLFEGYALLRPGAVRAGRDCEAIETLHPEQRTRFLVGYLTEVEMTYPEAQAFFESLEARAVWDEDMSARLSHQEIIPFMPDNWFQYVCDFTESSPNPHFTVFPEWEWFDGLDWPDGSYVTVTVEGKPGCEVTRQSWGGFFNGGFPEGCDLEIGDMVIFTDGETDRIHTVQSLAISGVDMDSDTVFGTADAGAVVYVWPHVNGEQIETTADGEGYWQADFSGLFDLLPRECGRSEIRDDMGNATAVDWCAPNTRFTVFPEWNYLEGYEWPDGALVSISVAGKEVCSISALSSYPEGDPANTFFSIDFPEGCEIGAGDLITLSSGSLSFTHLVPELIITEIDLDNDTLAGTAVFDPEQYFLHTWIHEVDGSYMQLSAEGGAWLADFGSQGFDLQPGMGGRVELVDQASNATAIEWSIPLPSFAAYMPGTIEGYDWPLGREVNLEINEGAYTATGISEQRPGFPEGETRVLFELWQGNFALEVGDHIIMTDGEVVKEMWVADLQVLDIDPSNFTVSGLYDPERSFWTQLEGQDPLDLQFDGNTWVAIFANMTPEAWGFVAQDDSDHDGTVWDFQIPRYVNSGNFYVEWHPVNPEEIVDFRWKSSQNLTNTGTHPACAGDLEFFGNSWVSENEGTGEFFFASLVGWGTNGSWSNVNGGQVDINSISSGCPGSTDIPIVTSYQVFNDEERANLVSFVRTFDFGGTSFQHDLRPYIPRLYPADGFTQVIHPDGEGASLVTDATCDFGCQATSWDGSWFAIHNPETGQGMIVMHEISDYQVALWLDNDAGSFTNSSSVLLLQPDGGFQDTVTEVEYLCFYNSDSWTPSLTSLPNGCQP